MSLLNEQQRRQRVFGDARIKVTESDLKGTQVIGSLYNLMRLDMSGNVPTGVGYAAFRLENATLSLTRFLYFNRGTEVRVAAEITDIWDMPDSPLHGTAFGSLRPLKDIKLPFFAEADKAMSAIQKEAVTVEIGGSVRDPKTRPIPFASLSAGFQAALLGGARGNDDVGEAFGE